MAFNAVSHLSPLTFNLVFYIYVYSHHYLPCHTVTAYNNVARTENKGYNKCVETVNKQTYLRLEVFTAVNI